MANVVTIALGVVALSFVWARLGDEPRAAVGLEARHIADAERLQEAGQWLGPRDAEVVIVEFGDYECPFCRRAERDLRALRDSFPSEVAIVYRHWPLLIHANARHAALLAECGGEQRLFEEVHALLYRAVALEGLSPERVAEEVGIPDVPSFLTCVNSGQLDGAIDRDIAAAEAIGLRAVPSFIVGDTLLGETPSLEEWVELVRRRRQ
ncbi:MAG: thioredoxin domain-containing protein [Gemmatimonadetes bacterium]|nr:thioredoxin domain-containing protein [Gemmatimonadota bacterium]